MALKKHILHLLYFIFMFSYGQETESDEYFSKIEMNKRFVELLYCGNKSHFTVRIDGKKIEEVEIEGDTDIENNKHFIAVDNTIIQSMIIPIPNYLKKFNSTDEEKVLDGYLTYELKFIKNELNANISDALMMPGNFQSRKYILWKYKLTDNININDGETVKGQIHISTVCFDQILTLSIPIMDLSMENKYKRKLVKIARQITMNEKRCEK
ncbi:hypothetical protein LV716_12995 [Flagellimonas sp. HMM57]|uniref:hypothetical protein n=1 Tax=unclassified Flagellimonas TaxID=2644544 RepID=UPI0013D59A4E|nr:MULTISPECIES: hypothetical protein [unclassified Flagellimonas]UII75171.1 hypothetical protein LV716_12995 [Flagellimonas sp. HMM57]